MERTIAQLLDDAYEHHAAARLAEAVDRYSQVVALAPDHSEAWWRLGTVARERGDDALALELIERALAVDPRNAAAHATTGAIREAANELRPAYASYAKACALDAGVVDASRGLARVALKLGRVSEAIAVAEAALACGDVDADVLRTLGAARALGRDFAAAVRALEASVSIEPHADTYANLAGAYLRLRRPDAALAASSEALVLEDGHAVATLHLGIAHLNQGNFFAALHAFERAVELGCEEAHINLGRLQLLLGDYHAGWPHFGWDDAVRRALPVRAALPQWDGASAPASRLLLWHEQGVGDTIAMARFVSCARERLGSITLAVPRETLALFEGLAGVDAVVDLRANMPFDAFDLWLPTIRLPVVFDPAPHALPAAAYLHADRGRAARYRPLLSSVEGLRVGLVWSGNPNFVRNDVRSCELADFAPLANLPGITWFALQQGAAAAQAPPAGMQLVPINTAVSDYADTAAIIEQLDLVITVDTSVANLAGALGRPVWIMLDTTPDWRWHLLGETTVWYPSARLFRQSTPGAWDSVIAAIATALSLLVP